MAVLATSNLNTKDILANISSLYTGGVLKGIYYQGVGMGTLKTLEEFRTQFGANWQGWNPTYCPGTYPEDRLTYAWTTRSLYCFKGFDFKY